MKFGASLCIDGKKQNAFNFENQSVTAMLTEEGDGYLYRNFLLSNQSENKSGRITNPYTLDVDIKCNKSVYIHSVKGDNFTKKSYEFNDATLEAGDSFLMIPSDGRSSDTAAFPFFDVTIDGKTYVFGIGWTGMWKCEIMRTSDSVNITVGLANADFYILPGESLNLPSVCIVEGNEGECSGDVRRRFRRVMLEHFNGMPKGYKQLPKAVSSFDCYFDWGNPWNNGAKWDEWLSYEGQIKCAQRQGKIRGMDTYWLDAAWFRNGFRTGVGNFSFEPAFDKGLKPLSDEVHKSGLRMLLWFEPERVYKDTDVYNAHPEYMLPCSTAENKNIFLYNLGDDNAYKYIRDELFKFIKDNGIDIYRQDFNISPINYWLENDEEGRKGITEIKHINNLYRLWDDMRQEFDGILIDNCAGGGRRIDLESIKRTCILWRSDIGNVPITDTLPVDMWQQNHVLAISEYLPCHSSGTWHTNANAVRSVATSGLNCIYDLLDDNFDTEEASLALDEVIHLGQYWDGDFYPLTKPVYNEEGFAGWQLNKDGNGFAVIFRRQNCAEDEFTVMFNGVDDNIEYSLYISDEYRKITAMTVSGKQLSGGYKVCLPKVRTSVVIEYRKNK